MENVHVLNHPLISHKIAQLRDVATKPAQFRLIISEIARLEAYEALRNQPTHTINVETPLEVTPQEVLDEANICFVPILRAGLSMSDGVSSLLPNAPIGHIGMYRENGTHIAHEYYSRFPDRVTEMSVLLLDPMLATGGSAIDAVRNLRNRGVKDIRFLCIIAAPEGVKRFHEEFPDVPLYIAALDRQLNENDYILPGLGDAGDRVFGTLL